ncbi:nucleotide exchange factor GrpE [Candidatus Peregrinibacteria bacterium]|nr:MAG: nucleotide exchange factor GrpE [Candidatus Peregrinibacteria bacterium]
MEDSSPNDDLAAKVSAAQQQDDAHNQAAAAGNDSKDEQAQQIADLKEALTRTAADFQNFKRRAEEDKMRFVKFANADLLQKLLPILDNFDRSCQHLPENLKEDSWAKGVIHTHDELMKTLDLIGVKRMETVGQKLNPNLHEAVMQGEGEPDIILEEFEPGYLYNDTLVKVAKVKVGVKS